jgi:hypothetical protein
MTFVGLRTNVRSFMPIAQGRRSALGLLMPKSRRHAERPQQPLRCFPARKEALPGERARKRLDPVGYMTLESVATVSDNPVVLLSAVPA